MTWTFRPPNYQFHDASGEWHGPDTGGELRWLEGESIEWTLTWSPASELGKSLVAPVTLEALAGRYEVPMSDQNPGGSMGWLEIDADGELCIEMPISYGDSHVECHFSARISLPDGDAGLIDFEAGSYHGRGWLADGPEGIELVLIGHNGIEHGAFGLVALPYD